MIKLSDLYNKNEDPIYKELLNYYIKNFQIPKTQPK